MVVSLPVRVLGCSGRAIRTLNSHKISPGLALPLQYVFSSAIASPIIFFKFSFIKSGFLRPSLGLVQTIDISCPRVWLQWILHDFKSVLRCN